eukprot:CAMPEP_0179270190 /NCGR_PEP_ID=MMETSP0797-20121207/31342_1 /TAXON_ID=47934 /ORGANISM="Dinophysis acuminata, Strain DAEP01" /LENGTH=181 /DNA_ID=CAMNT_0020978523 /DNA_START=170 /DNA_END=715 /DNA_ORIENTATION=-
MREHADSDSTSYAETQKVVRWRESEDEIRRQERQQEELVERWRLEEQMRQELVRLRREREETRERRRREEAVRAEAARQEEADRLAVDEERRALVEAFLREHGYSGVNTPKRTMLRTKYPIHTAAKMGDADILAALLDEGANPAQKNSVGLNASQVARQKNKNGSHEDVLCMLVGMELDFK